MKIILFICLFPLFVFGGGAINFDGVDDYIRVDDIPFRLANGSFSAWMKYFSYSTTYGAHILSKDKAGYNDDIYLGVSGATSGLDRQLMFSIQASTTSSSHTIYTPEVFPLNEMVYVSATWGSDGMKLYMNGILADDDPYTGGIVSAGEDLLIGTQQLVSGRFVNGQIGEILIYNTALSSEEIKAIYVSNGAWHPKAGLVSRWSMENNGVSTGQSHPNGSTIKDSVGSNNGTIVDGSDNSMTLESSPTRKKRGRR